MQASIQTSVPELRVGLVGAGRQGLALLDALFNPDDPVSGLRVEALCDIWPVALGTALRRAQAAGSSPRCYAEFDTLLAHEPRLDALIVATPDFSHAPIVLAALARGLHVYCESRMARSAGEATAMIRAARAAGRLLQVGYHRRSDPVYRAAVNKLARSGLLGAPVSVYAEHFCVERDPFAPLPAERILSADVLRSHGYASMEELRRWRRWRKFGGGPLPEPGLHQIDTMDWMIGGQLRRILAASDVSISPSVTWCADPSLLFEYEVAGQPVRAAYRSGSSAAPTEYGTHERFQGREGTFRISTGSNIVRALPERIAKPENWSGPPFDVCRYIDLMPDVPVHVVGPPNAMVSVCPTCAVLESYDMIVPEGHKRPFQPHLENFLAAIRGQETLTAPAETAYRTECLLDAIDAALCGRSGPAALPHSPTPVSQPIPAAPSSIADGPDWVA